MEGLSTFSYGFTPVLARSKWNFAQSVRTVNVACPICPEVSPTALIVERPGGAWAGIVMRVRNLPPGPVRACLRSAPWKKTSIRSEDPKPVPLKEVLVVGGPKIRPRWICGAKGEAATAGAPNATMRQRSGGALQRHRFSRDMAES